MTYVKNNQEQKAIFKHPNISLELRFSKTTKAFFLYGFRSTNLYRNPTDKHMYLNKKKNPATLNVKKNPFSLDLVSENAKYLNDMDITCTNNRRK